MQTLAEQILSHNESAETLLRRWFATCRSISALGWRLRSVTIVVPEDFRKRREVFQESAATIKKLTRHAQSLEFLESLNFENWDRCEARFLRAYYSFAAAMEEALALSAEHMLEKTDQTSWPQA